MPIPTARPTELDSFADRLLAWFDVHGRHDLPWQAGAGRKADAYRVWISEIMLQQTQVRTVIPYFEKFIARFPRLDALADAPLDDVLAHWSGLGYYARARNLHRAAQICVTAHGGELPRSIDALVALPGIGRSTGAAILAQTYGERHAILDGNVKRVLARFHAIAGRAGKADVLAALWARAEEHTPATRVADYTQAIMDLGATVCTRGRPSCGACPLGADCIALRDGRQAELPTPRARAGEARRVRAVTVLIVQTASGATLLERRPASGIWGGLLSFPELDASESAEDWCRRRLGTEAAAVADATHAAHAADAANAADATHAADAAHAAAATFAVSAAEALADVEHSFTHFDLTLKPLRLTIADGTRVVMDDDRWLWYKASEPVPGGIAAPIGKILREVTQSEGAQ